MSIFDRTYNRKETETSFILKSSGKTVCRLEAKLGKDDWEQLHALFAKEYQAGLCDGSEAKAAEIRTALGLSLSGDGKS